MGYESKIIIVERKEFEKWVYGGEIARFDLSKMGYEKVGNKTFHEIFTTPVDFDLYVNPENPETDYPPEYWREDCYGSICKWATVDDVLSWLDNSETGKTYRRASLLRDFLRILQNHSKDFCQLCVVHYGY